MAVGASAFDGCEALRFAAFEAASASFDEPDSLPLVFPGFARQGAQGYPEFEFDLDSLSFDLAEQGRGMVLYAERAPGAAVEGWSLVKATSTASGIVTLREGTASIGTGAFSGCAGVTSADFEAARGLRSIGDAAFFGAGLAGAVIVPGSVDYLGYGAFTACTALKSVHIEGSQLVDLGASAFSDCTALESVIFGPACALETIGGEAFSGTAVERIELPDSVIVLDFSAFSGCSRLAVLELPAGIEEIRSDAFNGCASLEAVTFSGEEPPQLVMYSWNTPFTFGSGLPDGFRIVLEGEAQQDDYIEVWKYPLVGRDPGSDVLEPEEDLAGTNAVRALLGLPPLAAPPEPS